MAETPAAAVEFGPHDILTLDGELLRVLITGDRVRLEEILREAGHGGDGGDHRNESPPHEVPPLEDGHRDPQTDGLQMIAINLPDAAPVAVEAGILPSPNSGADLTGCQKPCIAACLSSMARWCRARAVPHPARDVDPPVPITVAPAQHGRRSSILGVTSNGNTALHLVASRGHADLAALICERAPPSLVATRNRCLDTPLHCAAKAGHRDVADCLLQTIQTGTLTEATLQARNQAGATALHEAVRHGHVDVVDLLMTTAPWLASVTTDGGVSALYMAAASHSVEMVQRLLRPLRNGRQSPPASAAGPEGRTALHIAALSSTEGSAHHSVRVSVVGESTIFSRSSIHHALHMDDDTPALDDEASQQQDNMTKNGTIASVLIATVAFAAAFTVPGGFVTDDHPNAGTAILARRFAFRAFVVADTMAFLCSIVATCFLIYGNAREIPRSHRRIYSILASGLVPWGAQFLIGTFPLGFHLVMGGANRGLVIFVYTVSSAAVLFCFPGIWGAFCLGLGRAIWRRSGWRGIVNIHKRPSSLIELFTLLFTGPLIEIRRTLVAVLISATFIVVIVLDIYMPNY